MRLSTRPLLSALVLCAAAGATVASGAAGRAGLLSRADASAPAPVAGARPATTSALPAADEGGELQVSGAGRTEEAEGGRRYAGTAEVSVGGQSRHASVTVNVVEPFSETGTGAQMATTSHTFDFGGGDTFTTSEKLVVTPDPASGRLNVTAGLAVTGGTGAYANARGSLSLGGTMSGDRSASDWNVNGSLQN